LGDFWSLSKSDSRFQLHAQRKELAFSVFAIALASWPVCKFYLGNW
jgi:hypothetical protein